MTEDGGMWEHFVPVWEELRATRFPPILVGGYGLFLKQEWVHNGGDPSNPTALGPDRWQNAAPRVTGDYDLAIDVDIITPVLPQEDDPQEEIIGVLENNGFHYEHETTVNVTPVGGGEITQRKLSFDHAPEEKELIDRLALEHPGFSYKDIKEGSREKWRWLKPVENNSITVKTEFMSAGYKNRPSGVKEGPKRIRRRNKNRNLVEAHLHRELKGVESPGGNFLFSHKDVQIAVPNPMTWAVMKLNASGEKRMQATRSHKDWVDADYPSSPEQNTLERLDSYARKHAGDLWRIIAMATRDEVIGVNEELRRAVADGEKYITAQNYLREHFLSEDGFGVKVAQEDWEETDIKTMQGLLSEWFK